MHNVSFEEVRKHVPRDALSGLFVYRPRTDFSQFVMNVVAKVQELGVQRVMILVQKGVSEEVIDDATQRIAELLESEKEKHGNRKIALECFHGWTRADLRQLKRKWDRAQKAR